MADYNCPECGCGFTEKMGKQRVRRPHPFGNPANGDSRLHAWVLRFNNVFVNVFETYYKIVCPECGHTFGSRD